MENAAARAVAADGDDDDDSDSDDSEDASSSDSDAELDMPDESTMDRIMRLERAVADDPARYNAHVALIRELRGAKLRERARRAREAFAGSFALSEVQWREWIADEVADAKGKKKTRGAIVGPLFERAVQDVPGSVTLWLGYFEFSMDQDWESETRRALYERALESAGADFRDGGKIFAARRAFEESRHVVDGDDRAKVANRVRELFRRQLALPHARILETAAQAEAWATETKDTETRENASSPTSEQVLTPASRAAHAVAVAVTERRKPLEDAVAAAEALPDGAEESATEDEADEKRRRRRRRVREARAAALAAAHGALVAAAESEFETDAGNAHHVVSGMRADVKLATVASAYERALAASPTDESLWRRYTSRLERSATGRAAADAHARAIRHCPGSGETFASALRWQCARGDTEGARAALDTLRWRFGESPRDAHAALSAAARIGLISADQALARLSETTARGEGWLDPDLTLLRQSVRSCRDLESRRRLWDDFAETRFANVAEVHVARALFLADALGDDAAAAAAFKKAFAKRDALTSTSDRARAAAKPSPSADVESPGALVLCRAWMAFERSRGGVAAGARDGSGAGLAVSFLEADARAGAGLRAVEAARAARDALEAAACPFRPNRGFGASPARARRLSTPSAGGGEAARRVTFSAVTGERIEKPPTRTSREEAEARELAECTFAPRINRVAAFPGKAAEKRAKSGRGRRAAGATSEAENASKAVASARKPWEPRGARPSRPAMLRRPAPLAPPGFDDTVRRMREANARAAAKKDLMLGAVERRASWVDPREARARLAEEAEARKKAKSNPGFRERARARRAAALAAREASGGHGDTRRLDRIARETRSCPGAASAEPARPTPSAAPTRAPTPPSPAPARPAFVRRGARAFSKRATEAGLRNEGEKASPSTPVAFRVREGRLPPAPPRSAPPSSRRAGDAAPADSDGACGGSPRLPHLPETPSVFGSQSGSACAGGELAMTRSSPARLELPSDPSDPSDPKPSARSPPRSSSESPRSASFASTPGSARVSRSSAGSAPPTSARATPRVDGTAPTLSSSRGEAGSPSFGSPDTRGSASVSAGYPYADFALGQPLARIELTIGEAHGETSFLTFHENETADGAARRFCDANELPDSTVPDVRAVLEEALRRNEIVPNADDSDSFRDELSPNFRERRALTLSDLAA